MELGLQAVHTVASRITGSDTGAGAFLKSVPGARILGDIKRNLPPWRTGAVPEKPQACQGCTRGLSPLEIMFKMLRDGYNPRRVHTRSNIRGNERNGCGV